MCALLFILAAAPPASAGLIWNGGRDVAVDERPGAWLARWLERIAEWVGWGESDEPRAVVEGEGCGIEPNGTPCK
jgi:hypothetical protein